MKPKIILESRIASKSRERLRTAVPLWRGLAFSIPRALCLRLKVLKKRKAERAAILSKISKPPAEDLEGRVPREDLKVEGVLADDRQSSSDGSRDRHASQRNMLAGHHCQAPKISSAETIRVLEFHVLRRPAGGTRVRQRVRLLLRKDSLHVHQYSAAGAAAGKHPVQGASKKEKMLCERSCTSYFMKTLELS